MKENLFLINHVGYRCKADKRVCFTGTSNSFTVYRMQDCVLAPVFEGELKLSTGNEIATAKTGDFSSVKEPGIYRLANDEGNSRCFIISDDAYDTVARVLLNYFTWQRCNDDLGWHGNCHGGDSITLKSGETRSLGKGHHQSGDLRKWVWGTSIGILGLIEFALRERPLWDKGQAAAEIRHSCDYYLSLITDEGFLIDSTWIPADYQPKPGYKGFGDYMMSWNRRNYYEIPAPETAHWTVLRVLALASCIFSVQDAVYAHRCLEGAKKIWAYMHDGGSKLRDYDLPEYPPLGHDHFKTHFAGFYPGSALHHAGRAAAAIDLFRAESGDAYRDAAREALRELAKLQIAGHDNPASGCFWEGPDSEQLANTYTYYYYTSVPVAFSGALTLFADDPEASAWRQCVQRITDQNLAITQRNPFGRIPGLWHAQERVIGEPFYVSYDYFNYAYNLSLIAGGVLLAQAAVLMDHAGYAAAAQRQLDWILGANKYDASNVEGVGYNQPHRGIFGEFFPPTPQIPGAVFTHLLDQSFLPQTYGFDCEYDMPEVGWLMYLIAQINQTE